MWVYVCVWWRNERPIKWFKINNLHWKILNLRNRKWILIKRPIDYILELIKHKYIHIIIFLPKNPAKTKHLKCYLSDQGSAWLLLQPVKVEVFHSKPYVVMFHDLLSDKESNMIRKLAAPKVSQFINKLKLNKQFMLIVQIKLS